MAIKDDYHEEIPVYSNFSNSRYNLFILIYIIQFNPKFAEINPEFIAHEKSTIIEYLNLPENYNDKKLIENAIKHRIIEEKEFDWINESEHQAFWIENQLKINNLYSLGQIPPQPITHGNPLQSGEITDTDSFKMIIPSVIRGRKRSIAIIDYIYSTNRKPFEQNIIHVRQLRNSWNNHKEKTKKFNWIIDGNLEKIDFLWKWLESKDPKYTLNKPQFHDVDSLLINFESGYTEDEINYLITNARRIWNQKQLRKKNKNRKQCNFLLDEEKVSKLKKLAEKYNLSRTEIIEILIDSETKHAHYISERIDRKNQIKDPI